MTKLNINHDQFREIVMTLALHDFDVRQQVIASSIPKTRNHLEYLKGAITKFNTKLRSPRLSNRDKDFYTSDIKRTNFSIIKYKKRLKMLEVQSKKTFKFRNCNTRKEYHILNSLLKSGLYMAITIAPEQITALTKEIILQEKNIGKYALTIKLPQKTVKITSSFQCGCGDPARCGCTIHPHLSDRRMCLGNIKGNVTKLLRSNKFGQLLMQLNFFLNSYNPGSAYKHLYDFKGKAKYSKKYMQDHEYDRETERAVI